MEDSFHYPYCCSESAAMQRYRRTISRDLVIATSSAATPLSQIAEAFERLQATLSRNEELRLDNFCDACALVPVLLGCLGLTFKFAEMEYNAKLGDLTEASKSFATIKNIIDADVANCTVRKLGSHTRNLHRVRQGLDLIRVLFEQFLSSDDKPLKEAATTAYSQVCAPYHAWTIRTAVYAGMYALPSRDQLLRKLNENDQSAKKKMRRYINASISVIEYIDKLFWSRNIPLDW